MVQSCPPRKVARDGDTSLAGVDGKNYVIRPYWVRDDRPLYAEKRTDRIQITACLCPILIQSQA